MGLIDGAVAAGWAHARACRVLRSRTCGCIAGGPGWPRRARSRTVPPVGNAVHRILDVGGAGDPRSDRGVGCGRPLASQARASRLATSAPCSCRPRRCCASRSSTASSCRASRSAHDRQSPRFPRFRWEKNRIWIWDASHFTRCKRVAYAIVDVVTRYWIGYLLTTEQTAHAGAAAVRPGARGPGPARRGRAAARRATQDGADPGRLVGQRVGDESDRHPPVHGADGDRPAPRPARHARPTRRTSSRSSAI